MEGIFRDSSRSQGCLGSERELRDGRKEIRNQADQLVDEGES